MSKSDPAASVRGVVLVLGLAVLALGFLGLLSFAWSDPMTVDEVERSFSVSDGRRIEVRGRNGTIEYASWEGDEVVIRATKRVNGLLPWFAERIAKWVRVEIVQDAQGVTASQRGLGVVFAGNVSVSYQVLAPAGWSGDIELSTSNGRITAKDVRGSADFRSSNGPIVVDGQSGSLRVRTSNGFVELANVNGEVNASTSNGPIRIESGVLSGSGSIRTSNGAVSIRSGVERGASYNVRSSNGAISLFLVNPDVTLDLETSNGSINVEGEAAVSGGGRNSLQTRFGDGSAALVVRTSNGSIRVSQVLQ